MSFELIYAQKTVNAVREKSNLRYEQFVQAQTQKQQSGNIYSDAKAAEKKQAAPVQQVASEDNQLAFNAIA